ncbi:S-methyl-5'-thioadenosine phosphorylase isoform X2 [Leptidea sinapis]|uniref:S-methyl-5'-thioadenosine phosphorylase isoform X1 n=1 Tax=Leptidea sinapis TaxID=189913 RepID=UPI002125279D|nr:S-methyl-5'-thioadenosine phosphorylase isoform X1 [Leptidea sinapis]XP_050668515.1 S-methyl-5'-thioadenosine phosphorylase isoform X2 [Leptidea sinapis]
MGDTRKIKIGIIGGSGFDDPDLFKDPVEKCVSTPFGNPSDILLEGFIKGVPCVILARHGRKHQFQPSDINYRANIWALKTVGCTHILATTATGSLQENYAPGTLVIVDDFIDRTWGRACTFYDRTPGGPKGVCHLPMSPAFCEVTRGALCEAARARGYPCETSGTVVTIQGPRFSSKAESLMHRQWGGHLVNMTTVPEVTLAKEAGLSYAALALVTDYDCWRENEKSVCVSDVLEAFGKNVKKAADVILDAIQILAARSDHSYLDTCQELVSSSIMLKE